ncbi:hypothetical protein BE04_44845 [Sorangium cellulosum]|uniref:Tox-ART-HYD1 domain-containing protein n=2 Tax=Sorangium cellulosum TaxID=56 RepID=A0A150PCK6_SORCE|nr:hypothetical protein [Sorangium cellulosum]AGP36743.1 hypothetical protein SCE1572_20945 [Sorangium cellulosum So0157-2]KYF53423.1 hypothetical protein BE04_44845 [Sorangium cellulosum]
MTGDEIIQAILSEQYVFLHYTDAEGLNGILHDGVIHQDYKGVVYLTQEPMTQAQAHTNIFIGATTHSGRASHVLVLRLDSGLPIRRLADYEFSVDQNIKLHQHEVLYAGLNPF